MSNQVQVSQKEKQHTPLEIGHSLQAVMSFAEAEAKYDLDSFTFVIANQDDFKPYSYEIRKTLTPLMSISLFRNSGHSEHEMWMGNWLLKSLLENSESISVPFTCKENLANGSTVRRHMTADNRENWWKITEIDEQSKIAKVCFMLAFPIRA